MREIGKVFAEKFKDTGITKVVTINAGGVRHSEIARRLRVTGYPEDKITQAEKLEDIMTLIEKQDCDHAYILATYTAMLEFRDILAQRHAVGKGMN